MTKLTEYLNIIQEGSEPSTYACNKVKKLLVSGAEILKKHLQKYKDCKNWTCKDQIKTKGHELSQKLYAMEKNIRSGVNNEYNRPILNRVIW